MTDVNPWGAVYLPAHAYNAYQQWRDYDPAEARRDIGFAASLNLNALRVWLSYERWTEAPDDLQQAFDDFLAAAADRHVCIMPVLFESCGIEPTPEARNDTDPETAMCLRSPAEVIVEDQSKWSGPIEFVNWVNDRYRNDDRLLALECFNEPWGERVRLARAVLQRLSTNRGTVPLSFGAATLDQNMFMLDLGLDILQYHDNFPSDLEDFEANIRKAQLAADMLDRPVWLSEWQRLRPGGSGWGEQPIAGNEWQPGYATLVDTVRASGLGSFFWSLMVKPAYLPPQRAKGTVNGIFHPDGAVWSLDDARAVSGNPAFAAEERRSMD